VSTFVSISGSGKADVTVFGNGTVIAGNGTDKIDITGIGKIVVGNGNDTLTLGKGGTITEHGVSGHDTIHVGSTGVYTIHEEGHATVTGAFGSATINGGTLKIIEAPGQTPREIVTGGHVTISGAQSTSAGGQGSTGHGSAPGVTHGTTHGVLHVTHMHGHSTLLGGAHTTDFASGHAGLASTHAAAGQDSMVGGSTHNVFELYDKAGPAFLKNFVAGHDHLYLPGHSLAFTAAHAHDVSTNGDKTMISMDGGKTMIALHGIHVTGEKH
jgi:hypothetical protein